VIVGARSLKFSRDIPVTTGTKYPLEFSLGER